MESENLQLVTVEQAASIMGVKTGTVRLWLSRRMLPKVHLGKRAVRIPLSAIERFIGEGTIPPAERFRL